MEVAAFSCLLSFALTKLGNYLANEANLLTDVRKDVTRMKTRLEMMNLLFRDWSHANQEDYTAITENQVCQIRDIAHEVEDAIESYMYNKLNYAHTGVLKQRQRNYSFHKKVERIDGKLDDLKVTRETFNLPNARTGNSPVRNMLAERKALSPLDYKNNKGFEKEEKKIIRYLKDKEIRCCLISLIGIGGIGKSTLAAKVYYNSEIIDHFEVVVWVTVSVDNKVIDILKKIIRRIEPEANTELDEQELKERLWERLTIKGRYLIILDDVWQKPIWDSIRTAFPDNKDRSRVLITTRSMDVARSGGGNWHGVVYAMSYLNEAESVQLFLRKKNRKTFPRHLEIVGGELVRKCHGLPLALMKLGSHLFNQPHNSSSWERVLGTLNWQSNADVKNCIDTLALSYMFLPPEDPEIKLCFLYLGSFPENSAISARKLIRLWIAEGLIPLKPRETSEQTAERFLHRLIERCMVQVIDSSYDSKTKSIYIHRLLREFCILKAREDRFLHIVETTDNVSIFSNPESMRRLALHDHIDACIDSSTGKWMTPNLRSLLVFNLHEMSNTQKSLQGLNLLRAIDIYGEPGVQIVPDEIKNMKLLRYLRLRSKETDKPEPGGPGKKSLVPGPRQWWSVLREIFSPKHRGRGADIIPHTKRGSKTKFLILDLSDLHNLETLDADSGILGITLDVTGRLRKLQLLRSIKAGEWIDKQLPHLHGLRKLGIRDITVKQEVYLPKALARLDNLVSLTLESEQSDKGSIPTEVIEKLRNKDRLLSMKLNGPLSWPEKQLPNSDLFPRYLQRLILRNSRLERDPMSTLELLPSLVYLELSYDAYIGSKMTCTANNFCKLEYILIDRLAKLASWDVDDNAMPCLVHSTIRNCPLMGPIPRRLQQLVTAGRNCNCGIGNTESEFKRVRECICTGPGISCSSSCCAPFCSRGH